MRTFTSVINGQSEGLRAVSLWNSHTSFRPGHDSTPHYTPCSIY